MGELLGISGNYVGMLEAGREVDPDSSLYKLFCRFEAERLPRQSQRQSQSSGVSGPRANLKRARERAGLSVEELAKKIGRPTGYVQALEDSNARISMRTAERIIEALPELTIDDLLDGSDNANRVNDGITGTIGAKPDIVTPPGVEARFVPLISWAQCGAITDYEDIYDYEGYVAFNVKDPKAFAVTLKGDSMEPRYKAGDVAILYPLRRAETGNLVIAKIRDEGTVFKRFQILSRGTESAPARFRFTSDNPAYEPIERTEDEMEWIYPVASVVDHVL